MRSIPVCAGEYIVDRKNDRNDKREKRDGGREDSNYCKRSVRSVHVTFSLSPIQQYLSVSAIIVSIVASGHHA